MVFLKASWDNSPATVKIAGLSKIHFKAILGRKCGKVQIFVFTDDCFIEFQKWHQYSKLLEQIQVLV